MLLLNEVFLTLEHGNVSVVTAIHDLPGECAISVVDDDACLFGNLAEIVYVFTYLWKHQSTSVSHS